MAAEAVAPASGVAGCQFRRKSCVPARNQHYTESVARRLRVLNIATWISAVITGAWGIVSITGGHGLERVGIIQLISAVIFALIPLLHRYGEVPALLVFMFTASASIVLISWKLGTDAGLQFYFLVSASLVLLVVGIEHIALAASLAALGVVSIIALEFLFPEDTGRQPEWALTAGFVVSVISSFAMIFATVWYALREINRAEAAMEREYERSESLLANILPSSVAARLKDPARTVIADKYDDASILFADIAGFTKRASTTPPADLVRFLDLLYTEFDRLVDMHGLEKIKTSGDSYMVVSGVPHPRPDHLKALALLALDMAELVASIKDPEGRPVPMRIGLGAGPVVAGVVGARKFFYDVWGDAVNVASRMESTDTEGHIQVPQSIYERLKDDFIFEERGDVDVKGKGVMHTWFLVAQRDRDRHPAGAGAGGGTAG